MGTKYMQIKRYASTIIYYMRAGKDESLKTICNMFLTQYIETGNEMLYMYIKVFLILNNRIFNCQVKLRLEKFSIAFLLIKILTNQLTFCQDINYIIL